MSEEAFDLAVDHPDAFRRGAARQPGHGADVAHEGHHEARAGGQADLAHRQDMACGRAQQGRVGGERIGRLGDADRKPAPARRLEPGQVALRPRGQADPGGAVTLGYTAWRKAP